MFSDAHAVLDYFTEWMRQNQRTGPLWIMGRSLGNAPASWAPQRSSGRIAGLVIESGFAHTHDLLMRLGINPEWIGLSNRAVFQRRKTLRFAGPTLIIHGEYDQIIPLSHARDLHDRSPAARKKTLHIIPNADHNSLMMVGGRTYFEIIRDCSLHSDTE
ncbi:MAG: hypothetical protein R2875_04450 [Desulfobacterales bacterium]